MEYTPLYIVANWKMHPSSKKDVRALIQSLKKNLPRSSSSVIVPIAPPALYMDMVRDGLRSLPLCAQNISTDTEHAHTGGVSAPMFKDAGAKYVIVGHSEVRASGVSDTDVGSMLAQALKAGLTPILCVGEHVRDHNGFFLHEVKTSLEEAFRSVPRAQLSKVIIAYEPVWAISTNKGREATPEEFEEMIIFIRKVCADIVGAKVASSIPVLYGGSVDEKTAGGFLSAGARGLLVGRASLDAKKFAAIVALAQEHTKKK